MAGTRKLVVRLPGKGNSNSNCARPAHLIITMIKWIRTSRLSIKNSLPEWLAHGHRSRRGEAGVVDESLDCDGDKTHCTLSASQ
jgi:hypothetical protein